jgi:acyl carrier protein
VIARTTRERFIADMVAWLNASLAPPGTVVGADTPLFASGIISSIKVLELIAWTERAIGRQIADGDIRLDNFRTVARIAEVFVKEAGHAAA